MGKPILINMYFRVKTFLVLFRLLCIGFFSMPSFDKAIWVVAKSKMFKTTRLTPKQSNSCNNPIKTKPEVITKKQESKANKIIKVTTIYSFFKIKTRLFLSIFYLSFAQLSTNSKKDSNLITLRSSCKSQYL